MKDQSLVIIGTGIKFISHLTTESQVYIKNSPCLLYLVNDPAMKTWITKHNIKAYNLDKIYFNYQNKKDAYTAITNHILECLEINNHVCVVVYGHPTVCTEPALNAARVAKKQGIYTKVLPAISAEACLYADLLIDPSSCGSQSYEALDFLINQRIPSITSHLILWQPGMLGSRLNDLKNYLSKHYMNNALITLYEAAQYPTFEPRIETISISNLSQKNLTPITTLYIPPKIPQICTKKLHIQI